MSHVAGRAAEPHDPHARAPPDAARATASPRSGATTARRSRCTSPGTTSCRIHESLRRDARDGRRDHRPRVGHRGACRSARSRSPRARPRPLAPIPSPDGWRPPEQLGLFDRAAGRLPQAPPPERRAARPNANDNGGPTAPVLPGAPEVPELRRGGRRGRGADDGARFPAPPDTGVVSFGRGLGTVGVSTPASREPGSASLEPGGARREPRSASREPGRTASLVRQLGELGEGGQSPNPGWARPAVAIIRSSAAVTAWPRRLLLRLQGAPYGRDPLGRPATSAMLPPPAVPHDRTTPTTSLRPQIVATLLIGIATLAIGAPRCGEPVLDAQQQHGREIYGRMCAVCHGPNGEGYRADEATALSNRAFLATASDELLRTAITEGAPGHDHVGVGEHARRPARAGPTSTRSSRTCGAGGGDPRPRSTSGPSRATRRGARRSTRATACAATADKGRGGPNVHIGDAQLLGLSSNGFLRGGDPRRPGADGDGGLRRRAGRRGRRGRRRAPAELAGDGPRLRGHASGARGAAPARARAALPARARAGRLPARAGHDAGRRSSRRSSIAARRWRCSMRARRATT